MDPMTMLVQSLAINATNLEALRKAPPTAENLGLLRQMAGILRGVADQLDAFATRASQMTAGPKN